MHRKRVWLGIAASVLWLACGDAPEGQGGSVDGGRDSSSAVEASASGDADDGGAALPSDVTYPDCRSATLKRTFFPCAATRQCVEDCAECALTPINCVGAGDCPTGVVDSDRKCVAHCSQCAFDAGAVLSEGTDVCSNTCTNTRTDSCNCGACGNSYPADAPSGTRCEQGHFCPPLPDHSPTVFVPDCAGDAGDAGRCCLSSESCLFFIDTQCVAPL